MSGGGIGTECIVILVGAFVGGYKVAAEMVGEANFRENFAGMKKWCGCWQGYKRNRGFTRVK